MDYSPWLEREILQFLKRSKMLCEVLDYVTYLYVKIPDLMYNNDNQTTYSANYSNVNVIWHHKYITKNISI